MGAGDTLRVTLSMLVSLDVKRISLCSVECQEISMFETEKLPSGGDLASVECQDLMIGKTPFNNTVSCDGLFVDPRTAVQYPIPPSTSYETSYLAMGKKIGVSNCDDLPADASGNAILGKSYASGGGAHALKFQDNQGRTRRCRALASGTLDRSLRFGFSTSRSQEMESSSEPLSPTRTDHVQKPRSPMQVESPLITNFLLFWGLVVRLSGVETLSRDEGREGGRERRRDGEKEPFTMWVSMYSYVRIAYGCVCVCVCVNMQDSHIECLYMNA